MAERETTQQQLEAYCAWVNSQLKKRPDTHTVEDLKTDMRDGVAFANLIEIVACETLPNIKGAPSNAEEMRSNVNQVLRFMYTRRIKMHQIKAEDVVEGNIKCIMRLILALAAHFKPGSVRYSAAAAGGNTGGTTNATTTTASQQQQQSAQERHLKTNTSLSSLAHGAATALAEARQDASSSVPLHRPKHLTQSKRYASGSDSSESPLSSSFDGVPPQQHHSQHGHQPPLSSSNAQSSLHHTSSHQYLPHSHNQTHPSPHLQYPSDSTRLHSRSQSHHALGRIPGMDPTHDLHRPSQSRPSQGHTDSDSVDTQSACSATSSLGQDNAADDSRLTGTVEGSRTPHGLSAGHRWPRGSNSSYSSGGGGADSPPSSRRLDSSSEGRYPIGSNSAHSTASHHQNHSINRSKPQDLSSHPGCDSPLSSSSIPPSNHNASSSHVISVQAWNDLMQQHQEVIQDLHQTRQALSTLQKLLLKGSDGEAADDDEVNQNTELVEGDNDFENIVIYKSKLQQTEEVNHNLREELSRCKNDCMQLQGTKAGLQQRLCDEEEKLAKIRSEMIRDKVERERLQSELIRDSGECNQLRSDKAEILKQCSDKDSLIKTLRLELNDRDLYIEDLVNNIRLQEQRSKIAADNLRLQINDLHERITATTDKELSMSNKIRKQDDLMSQLENELKNSFGDSDGGNVSHPTSSSRSGQSSGDELQMMRDSVNNLRSSLPGNSFQNENIDQLEHSISVLMDRLQIKNNHHYQQATSEDSLHQRINYDSAGDMRRSPFTGHQGLFLPPDVDNSPENSTKMLCFTETALRPFMHYIPKRLDDITLRDIKNIIDRKNSNKYRYHFKTMDPEFGTVKEEISEPDAIIPGWEGKIVAWIEKDSG